MQTQRLPRAFDIKKKVDHGSTLNSFEIAFLREVFEDANRIKPLLDRHPEYEKLVAQVIHLYKQITDKALENEKNHQGNE